MSRICASTQMHKAKQQQKIFIQLQQQKPSERRRKTFLKTSQEQRSKRSKYSLKSLFRGHISIKSHIEDNKRKKSEVRKEIFQGWTSRILFSVSVF